QEKLPAPLSRRPGSGSALSLGPLGPCGWGKGGAILPPVRPGWQNGALAEGAGPLGLALRPDHSATCHQRVGASQATPPNSPPALPKSPALNPPGPPETLRPSPRE